VLGAGVYTPDLVEAFRDGLREAGYVEGRNVLIERRYAEGQYHRLATFADEFVRTGVDAIFATGDRPADAAKRATDAIPIVFSGVTDPIERQFISSFGRPGGNMTGLTLADTQVTGKRLSFLKEAVPKVSRVAVLWNPTGRSEHLSVSHSSARGLGLRSRAFEARTVKELDMTFVAIAKDRADVVILLPDTMLYQARERLGQLALRHRLPMVGWRGDFARAGALIGYGASLTGDFRRAGMLVGKVLSGAKPAELPVEEPSTFELVINLKTAKALGLTIPPSLLQRADQVIE
jgi:putative ABC transport system substrate-binding protein